MLFRIFFLKLDVAYYDAGSLKRIITCLSVINVKQNNNLKDKLIVMNSKILSTLAIVLSSNFSVFSAVDLQAGQSQINDVCRLS